MPSLTIGATPSGKPMGRVGGVESSSSRKSANRYFSEETMPSSDTRATRSHIPQAILSSDLGLGNLRRLQRQPPLQRIKVLEQARAGELEEVETEGRILHIELLDLVVAHGQDDAALDAFQRLRAHVRWRQHADVADNGADRQLNAGLDQAKAAADDVKHILGLLILVEQHLAGGAFALGHERLQPLHRQVAANRTLHVAHELKHLMQPV